ncbi:hypothetical protein NEIMUCOT_04633 [Neisseria mucosa ATCC 25996]|uniref:Uncharacterized protein n=1 Tax=Neisseria mucosa (strain ATCC 25996 / DSM 4631 / NCTC 10774 / M26) TaxID=546266 RepID=D2ZVJ0_NEIM2|nr:hypothetical protein NEIMUCOT_04633 [Neisseria mucosa ATCC 25996]
MSFDLSFDEQEKSHIRTLRTSIPNRLFVSLSFPFFAQTQADMTLPIPDKARLP